MEDISTEEIPHEYDQPDLWDRLIAFLLGAAATVALFLLTFAEGDGLVLSNLGNLFSVSFWQDLALNFLTFSAADLHPGSWTMASEAAGLIPPETVAPGLARLLAVGLCSLVGVTYLPLALAVLGLFSCGVCTFYFYLLLRELLPAVLSLRSDSVLWAQRLERVVAGVGTLVFLRAEPVWRLFQGFSSETLLFLLTLVFFRAFLKLLHYGRFSTSYFCLFILGLLAGETPAGLALSAFAYVATAFARRNAWRPDLRFLNPMLVELSKWRLSLFFLLGFTSSFLADGAYFIQAGGPAAVGRNLAEVVVDWLVRYGLSAWEAARPLGWILTAVFALLPFVVAVCNAKRATDDDAFLPFRTGLVFAVIFFLTLAPLSNFPRLQFWNWSRAAVVASTGLLAFVVGLLAVAFALALSVFLFDLWCRDHRRIAVQRFPELLEDGRFARQHFRWRWRRTITLIVVLSIAYAVAPGRRDQAAHRLARVVAEAVRSTVAECGNAKVVVTDGSYDEALRLAAAGEGRSLCPVSIMAGRTPYERTLRLKAAANDEERTTLLLGVADTLRAWAFESTNRFSEVALQIGFELWRDKRAARPPAAGFVLRRGLDDAFCAARAEVARELARRVAALQRGNVFARCEDRLLRRQFLFAQWRLARIGSVRAENADAARRLDLAREEAKLVEELDDLNPEFRRVRDAVNWIRSRDGDSLTPREGLRIALERADFALARRYATPILSADAESPDANFGMGMSYFVEEKYTQAEAFLKKALIRRPDEPAVLNNLAICCYKTGRAKEALAYAEKAVAKLPDAPSVVKTYEEIKKAAAAAANGGNTLKK